MNMPVHDQEFNGFDRRQFLAAAPACAVGALASGAIVAGEASAAEVIDPIVPLFHEWVAARREWYRYADVPGNGNFDMPESLAAQEREDAAFWAMNDMTPSSLAGVAALATVLWDLIGPPVDESHDEFGVFADFPENKLIRAIYRAGSGESGLPLKGKMERRV